MRKPDWKVAVIGGSIAALGLGGFAAAQSGSSSTDTTVPEGIRLQRDASVSIHSLSSVIEVQRDITNTQASVNSVDNASLDSIPQVAPAPAQVTPAPVAPAPVDSWDSPASVQSLDSPASVQSVDSPDSSN